MTPLQRRREMAFAEIRRQERFENLALLGLKLAAYAVVVAAIAGAIIYLGG